METQTAPGGDSDGDVNRSPASIMGQNPIGGDQDSLNPTPQPHEGAPVGRATNTPPQTGAINPQAGSVDLPNYQKRWDSGDAGPGLSAKPSKWDKFTGKLRLGVQGSVLGGTLPRLWNEATSETGTQLTPDQANKLNPYRATPYTTSVDSGIVAMEAADGRKRSDIQEWLGRNDLGNGWGTAGQLLGGFTDVPLYAAVGALTGGVGDLVVGGAEATLSGAAARAAAVTARYGWTLGEFSAIGRAQNKLEMGMGEKEKSFGEVVQENLIGAAIGTGAHIWGESRAAAREMLNRGGGDAAAIERGVKENAAALANDERPQPGATGTAMAERRAGVTADPAGDKIAPTVKTSPFHETPFYAATHPDGAPLVHEHGLGEGVQLTDSYHVANNGVSKSSDLPGQIAETKIPEGTKLLDLDRAAAEDYAAKDGLLKAIEEKTGVPLDHVANSTDSIKDVITNLGDYAGVEIGNGKTIPQDILKQIQDIAKEQGYSGYQFDKATNRQVHIFDPVESGLHPTNVEHADPGLTPDIPGPESAPPPETPEAKEAQAKQNSQNYSPNAAARIQEIHKTAKTLHPDDIAVQMAETEKVLADHKQQLSELAKKFDEENNPKPPTTKRLLTKAEDFQDIASRVKEAPTEEATLKDGGKIKINVEMVTEKVYAAATDGMVNKDYPTIVARTPDGEVIGKVSVDGRMMRDVVWPDGITEDQKQDMIVAGDSPELTDTGFKTYSEMTKVNKEFLRKGVATAMYDYGNKYVAELNNTNAQTPVGRLFRKAYDARPAPEPVENPIKEQLKELREQEAHDKRNLDLAKRMMNCAGNE